MNKIIIINGKGGSGKDTFIHLCQKYMDNIINISSVDYVKEVAQFCGWDGEKDLASRKFLSDLKDVLTVWRDIPYNKMIEQVKTHENKLIFIHVREPKEIERLKIALNANTLLVKNDNIIFAFGNHADDMVESCEYDYIITNNGTLQDLEKSAKIFVDFISCVA